MCELGAEECRRGTSAFLILSSAQYVMGCHKGQHKGQLRLDTHTDWTSQPCPETYHLHSHKARICAQKQTITTPLRYYTHVYTQAHTDLMPGLLTCIMRGKKKEKKNTLATATYVLPHPGWGFRVE